jgi:serine/threonine-protein kinase
MSPPLSIAHYRDISKLGEGGMGEVWRATDIRLNRDVAIKVLTASFAADDDRLARFAREAQVAASLNHPNIAAIYGVEERALVMELVEGPTLAERIARGPIPLDEALPIARQIAEAMEYAHDRGIVHRDLKPANIKVTPEGRVKVLDFGLAKAMSTEAPVGDPTSSPTLTINESMAGMILGTAAYMAPEQARGHAVDSRADIWAFGVVLYEMLTGRPLFAGATISDTIAAVLKTEPDLSAMPAEVRPLVERCLRKDPRRRWQCIGDVRIALEEGLPVVPSIPSVARHQAIPWTIAAALAVAATIGGIGWWRATRPVDRPLTRLSVDLGPDALPGLNLTMAISPDGRRIVFPVRGPNGTQQLAMRLLDKDDATLLPGTENGRDPFFSPEGGWIGFVANGQLYKVSVLGGAPSALAATNIAPQGASWGADGNIVAALGLLMPLSLVPAAGGPPQRLTEFAAGESTHRWPQVLPGGNAVIFTASVQGTVMREADIQAISLKTRQTRTLVRGGYYGRYLPSGHLVYLREGRLYGLAFDPVRLEVRGEGTPVLEHVAANPLTGGGQFDFSSPGTFVYTAGTGAAQKWQVTWLDSSGKMEPLLTEPRVYTFLRLSPDARKLAFVEFGGDLHVHDIERDSTIRLTFTGPPGIPVWTPDGKHLVCQSAANKFGLAWVRSDGGGELQKLTEGSENVMTPWSFSPDGRRLAGFQRATEPGFDIWTLPLDLSDPDRPRAGKPEVFLRTTADEMAPQFSPDSRWIAYRSNESRTSEIYVRPFPGGKGGKWQISSGGGLYALWSKNGRELFYETADNRIMVVDYSVEDGSFIPGKPRLWCDRQLFYSGTSNLDLAPDGKRFAVLHLQESPKASPRVVFLLNFFDELRRRIPAGG